jgi:homoserine dehydrogenase
MPRSPTRSRRSLRIALLGFGRVGRRFAELLLGPYGRILRQRGFEPLVTGIATGRHGIALDAAGLPLKACLSLVKKGASLGSLHQGRSLPTPVDFIRKVPADVLVEITPLEPRTGEPALTHVRTALSRGLHVVTANKGPVAFGRGQLLALAQRKGRFFLHEGTVMDGTPIFNLAEHCLPGVRVLGFRGLLNSTTTRILSRMEEGLSFEEALREAQAAGVAEADPRNDLDGWDAAVKGCVVANALMGAQVTPPDVKRKGIAGISGDDLRRAICVGRRLRLIVRGRRVGRKVAVSVVPETLEIDDLLVSGGADGVLVLETDLMGEIGIWEGAGGVDQTAYALLADVVRIAEMEQ